MNHRHEALEALRGDKTIQEISAKRQLHPTQATTWKRQAQEGLAGVFSDNAKKSESKGSEITYIPVKHGFCIWWQSWIGRRAKCCLGGYQTRWMQAFESSASGGPSNKRPSI